MWFSGSKRLVVAVVSIVVYLVLALMTIFAAGKLAKPDEGHGVTSEHTRAIRACVVPPGTETLDDVGGLSEAKAVLRRTVLLPLRHPETFFAGPKALRPARGVLLQGPPGTGKTMLARALASESNVNFLSLSSATLQNKYWGESSKLVQAAFELARTELQPCIIFFDELDGLGRTRTESDQACDYQFKTELLRNMDGIDAQHRDAALVACQRR